MCSYFVTKILKKRLLVRSLPFRVSLFHPPQQLKQWLKLLRRGLSFIAVFRLRMATGLETMEGLFSCFQVTHSQNVIKKYP